MHAIEVCLSPALIHLCGNDRIMVVIDVLRATTSFCTAFDYGVSAIVPIQSIELAKKLKGEGKLIAAERDGLKPDFADFSNSPFDYMNDSVRDKTIYYTTTNGTYAIQKASEKGTVAIGSFLNIPALTDWLSQQNKDITFVCSGWKKNFCIEDTLCAGAFIEQLCINHNFKIEGDAAEMAHMLWINAKGNLSEAVKKAAHFIRLQKLGLAGVLDYALKIGESNSVPVLRNDRLIDVSK